MLGCCIVSLFLFELGVGVVLGLIYDNSSSSSPRGRTAVEETHSSEGQSQQHRSSLTHQRGYAGQQQGLHSYPVHATAAAASTLAAVVLCSVLWSLETRSNL